MKFNFPKIGFSKKEEEKKDPVCGMIVKSGRNSFDGHWFCSKDCLNKYKKNKK